MLMFFFFKQKTAYEMRISDWSSDVYSSDLARRRTAIRWIRRRLRKYFARRRKEDLIPTPFVLSLSKHRSSLALQERTALRQAQGERVLRYLLRAFFAPLRLCAKQKFTPPPGSTDH